MTAPSAAVSVTVESHRINNKYFIRNLRISS
jgi:hypothetical protein